jgi:hypothetical protein
MMAAQQHGLIVWEMYQLLSENGMIHKGFTADTSDFTNTPMRFTSSGAPAGVQIETKSPFPRQCGDELNAPRTS